MNLILNSIISSGLIDSIPEIMAHGKKKYKEVLNNFKIEYLRSKSLSKIAIVSKTI